MEKYKTKFAERFSEVVELLKEERRIKSIRDMAKISDVSEGTLRHYLNRKGEPSAETIAKLCQSLEISPAWLLWGQGEIFVKNTGMATVIVSLFSTINQHQLTFEALAKLYYFSLERFQLMTMRMAFKSEYSNLTQDQRENGLALLEFHLMKLFEIRCQGATEILRVNCSENLNKLSSAHWGETFKKITEQLAPLDNDIENFVNLKAEEAHELISTKLNLQ